MSGATNKQAIVVQTIYCLQLVGPFKRFCSNRFCERVLIPPTTTGRFCVQRVVLCVHTRISRAMKREAGGFRLQDAIRACVALACAQRARVAPRRPRGLDDRMFTAVKLLVTSGAYLRPPYW